jgi:beta-1,4-mannosyl-glycoprotein beta-1,4-N-acetylglucosaminyltransferase
MIFDGFTFLNEFDLLEIRLHELDDVVDYFILVESDLTFSKKQKPLYFNENKSRFEKFLPKIIHIVVQDMPMGNNPWEREAWQRNAILRGWPSKRGDYLIVSDVDEIPRASTLKSMLPISSPKQLHMQSYGGYLNCPCGDWRYACVMPTGTAGNLEQLRHKNHPLVENGGWHFSSVGGAKAVGMKLDSYSHQEASVQRFNNKAKIEAYLKFGFGVLGGHHQFVEIDSTFPRYVVEHQDQLKKAGFIFEPRPYVKYIPSGSSCLSVEELDWLHHVCVGYDSAIQVGNDSEVTQAMSVVPHLTRVDTLGDQSADLVFIENFSGQKPNAKKVICGNAYHQVKDLVHAAFGNVDLIDDLWAIVLN